jgi:DNA-binding response OmpR family regulator
VILVADDDGFSQNLAKLLEDSGFGVDLAVSARMAGALLERHHDAVVILDLNAQRMHAVEFALSLRGRSPRVPAMPNLAQHCKALGVRHWLAQPFRLGELLDVLDRLTRRPIPLVTRVTARGTASPAP